MGRHLKLKDLAAAVVLAATLAAFSFPAAGCGKKGPPVPPPDKPEKAAYGLAGPPRS